MDKTTTVEVGIGTAIATKYHGTTRRIRVWRADGSPADDPMSLYVPMDNALSSEENHAHAIAEYVKRHNDAGHAWFGQWVMAGAGNGTGYVAVRRWDNPGCRTVIIAV